MKENQEKKYNSLREEWDQNLEKMSAFMKLADVEMPKMRYDAEKASARALRAKVF